MKHLAVLFGFCICLLTVSQALAAPAADTIVTADDHHAYKFLAHQKLEFASRRMILDIDYNPLSYQEISKISVVCGGHAKSVKMKEKYFAYWPINIVEGYHDGRDDPEFSIVKIDVSTDKEDKDPEYNISITCDHKEIRIDMPPENVIDYYKLK